MGRLYDAYIEVGPRFAGFGDIKKQGASAGREYGKALSDAAAKAAQANVRSLGQALAKARTAEADAVGKVRTAEASLSAVRGAANTAAGKVTAAEAKLTELRAKGAPAKQTATAEAALQKARDAEAATAARLVSAEESLASAQRKSATASGTAKDAAKALEEGQKRAAAAADTTGQVSGGRFSAAFRKAAGKIGGDKEGKEFATRFGVGMNGAIGGIVSRSAGIFVAGFAAIKSAQVFGGFIKDAAYSAQVARVSAQAIKSTGGAAKITADQVGDLATAISNKTGADDEAIQSGANLLLTFTNIKNGVGAGNDIFNQATSAITDMTAAMNDGQVTQQGLKTSAIQVGKALNDPIKGVTALQKVGVTFTAEQKKQIETLVKSGKTMQAQKIILGELGKEFGGAAAAAGDPFTRLTTIFGNLGEQIGGYLLPYANKFANFVSNKLIPGISGLADLLVHGDFTSSFRQAFNVEEDSGFVTFLLKIHDVGAKVFTELAGGIRAFGAAWKANDGDVTSSGFPGFMERVAYAAHQAFGFFKTEVLPRLRDFAGFVLGNVIPAVKNLIAAFAPVATDIGGAVVNAFKSLAPAAESFGRFIGGALPALKNFTGFLRDNKTLVGSIAVAVLTMVGAYKAYQGALFVAAVAGKAYAAVQALINVVMDANPIGIVVLALAGLAAGLVYAYKHSEKFRDIVNGVFNAVKGTVTTVINALVTAFHAVAGALGTAFSAVKGAVTSAIDGVVTAFNAVKSGVAAAVGFVGKVWSTIVAVVSAPIQAVIGVISAIWSRVSPILVLPFYIAKTAITSVFTGIQVVFSTVAGWVKGTFSKAWAAVTNVLSGPINLAKAAISRTWTGISAAFVAVKNFVVGAFAKAWAAAKEVVAAPIRGAKAVLDTIWSGIKTAFNSTKAYVTGAFSKAWSGVKSIITTPISLARTAISGILGNAKGGLQYIFSTSVTAISSIWNRLQGLAKVPIRFIVDTVLNNGLIAGFNWIAGKFGAPTIPPIPLPKGFADGGHFDGRLPGPPSSKDNLLGYAKGGAFGLASGEYVVNARQTAKNLPLLEAINSGDGFADGGLIGGLKKAISTAFTIGSPLGALENKFLGNPVDWLKNRFIAPLHALDQLGDSPFAQIVKAVPRKIASAIEDKAKALAGLGGGGGSGFNASLAGVLSFVRSHVGDPYVWGGVGPHGFDCSGLVGAAINVALGRPPYSRIGSTASMPWSMFAPGGGAFEVGWFQGNPGHTAATVNGTNIESSGGVGVHMGPGARGARNSLFSHLAHVKGFAQGGLLGDPPFDLLDPRGKHFLGRSRAREIGVYDKGGRWPSGTLGVNTSGKTETVIPGDGQIELSDRSLQRLAALLRDALTIDGRSLDTALSRSALGRGY